MMWLWMFVIWAACSILSYGLHKGSFLNHLDFFTEMGGSPDYSSNEELFVVTTSMFGPMSLIAILIASFVGPESFTSRGPRLCFLMPEKYKKK